MTTTDLHHEDLEALWARPRPLAVPTGRWQGEVLRRLDTPGARRLVHRASQWVGFEAMSWGIDFDRRRWWFGPAGVRIGRFDARIGPSRWRDTDAVQLHYDPSRLPGPIKGRLYDEIKPLSEELVLGLGGVNAERGEGDHFWFVLTRR